MIRVEKLPSIERPSDRRIWLTWRIPRGEFVVLQGPSDCGKTDFVVGGRSFIAALRAVKRINLGEIVRERSV